MNDQKNKPVIFFVDDAINYKATHPTAKADHESILEHIKSIESQGCDVEKFSTIEGFVEKLKTPNVKVNGIILDIMIQTKERDLSILNRDDIVINRGYSTGCLVAYELITTEITELQNYKNIPILLFSNLPKFAIESQFNDVFEKLENKDYKHISIKSKTDDSLESNNLKDWIQIIKNET
jgi:hypothetical protein